MLHFIETHGFETLAFYWILSVLIGQMPAPDAKESKFYQYAYNVLHGLLQLAAANIGRVPGLNRMIGAGGSGLGTGEVKP